MPTLNPPVGGVWVWAGAGSAMPAAIAAASVKQRTCFFIRAPNSQAQRAAPNDNVGRDPARWAKTRTRLFPIIVPRRAAFSPLSHGAWTDSQPNHTRRTMYAGRGVQARIRQPQALHRPPAN